ncbi:MAG: ABC transporter permease [Aeromicrobium sp.]
MSTLTATSPTTRRRPLAALAKAEYLQFRRNTTLMVMGVLFPVAIPLVPFFIALKDGDPTADLMATTFEMFALMALLFVQYYSVLSMITTRRSEGVLKRLRTGESADWQIQVAPMVPGAVLSVVGVVLIAAVTYAFGGPAPVNVAAMALAVVGGVITFSVLALATSVVTKNTEAAQITSLPLMTVAIVGLASIRNLLPDNLADIVTWTPFAAISDLMSLGAEGRLATATESSAALDFAGTCAEMGQPVAILAVWSLLALALVRKSFRWDDRG